MKLHTKLLLLSTLVIVASVGAVYLYPTTALSTDQKTVAKSKFVCDSPKNDTWKAERNAYPQEDVTDEYIGDAADLPTLSMTIHQKAPECFVSYGYHAGKSVDVAAKAKEKADRLVYGADTLTARETGVRAFKITGNTPDIDVTLHEYELSGAHATPIKRGVAVGYANTTNGHIEVQAHCPTPEDLAGALSVYEAVKFLQADSSMR